MFLIYQVSRINCDYVLHYNSINLFLIIAVMFREGQARSPTKSERDSAVLEGLARGEGLSFFCNDCGDGEVRRSNPSGSRPNSFGRQHLTFDKGGKFSAGRGIIVLLQWL